jgi:hypothetical protein
VDVSGWGSSWGGDGIPAYKRLSALERLRARAEAWRLKCWLACALMTGKAERITLVGPQATGKTEFIDDLQHLGIKVDVREANDRGDARGKVVYTFKVFE